MDEMHRAVVDQAIRKSLRTGDLQAAATQAIESYGPEILLHLIHVMRDEFDAQEVFSQFCEDLWRGIGRFRLGSSVRTWMYRLAVSARSRFYRDPYRWRRERLDTEQAEKLATKVVESTRSRWKEREDRLERLRQELEPEEQELLTLRVAKKMSWREIAEIESGLEEELSEGELGRKAAALRKKYQRLKEKIRRRLKEQ